MASDFAAEVAPAEGTATGTAAQPVQVVHFEVPPDLEPIQVVVEGAAAVPVSGPAPGVEPVEEGVGPAAVGPDEVQRATPAEVETAAADGPPVPRFNSSVEELEGAV
jgi:hypothetical protein